MIDGIGQRGVGVDLSEGRTGRIIGEGHVVGIGRGQDADGVDGIMRGGTKPWGKWDRHREAGRSELDCSRTVNLAEYLVKTTIKAQPALGNGILTAKIAVVIWKLGLLGHLPGSSRKCELVRLNATDH